MVWATLSWYNVGLSIDLEEWNASIIRKLHTLESIYEKISDRATHPAYGSPGVDYHYFDSSIYVLPCVARLPQH